MKLPTLPKDPDFWIIVVMFGSFLSIPLAGMVGCFIHHFFLQ